MAVIIGTIIEMILPEGNSKKYIKVVIGIYVLFTIVSPVITKISGKEIQVSDILDLDEYIEEAKTASETQNQMELQNEDNILSIYVSGIKEDMKAKIEGKGYVVDDININVAKDGSYEIQSIVLDVEKRTNYSTENTKTESTENQLDNIENVESIEKVNRVDISVLNDNIEKSNNNNSSNNSIKNATETMSNRNNDLSIMQKQELKEYISSVYEINPKNTTINECRVWGQALVRNRCRVWGQALFRHRCRVWGQALFRHGCRVWGQALFPTEMSSLGTGPVLVIEIYKS